MTKNGKTRKRLWALLLSAVMIVTQLPAVAMAENHAPEDGSIASFEALPSGLANQTVDVGRSLSGLNLPDEVTATVYHVSEDTIIPDDDNTEDENGDPSVATPSEAGESVSGNNAGDSSTKDSGKTVTTVTTSTEKIPVTWDSEPAYDGNTEGKYVFTADVDGYALSGSAKLPQITVTVTADTVEKPTESQPAEPLSCTKTEGCTLADGHEGDCVITPPANGELVKNITGWTFVDDENLNEGVLPLINVSMEHQADFDTVVDLLPKQISGSIEGEADPATVNITGWACPEYIQDGDGNWPLTGDYTFTAALPQGYACEPLPTVKVLLGGANTFDANNTITEGGLTVAASNGGEVEYTAGSGFTLKESGDYTISGTWNGTLNASDNAKKAVITVPSGVTANVTLSSVSIDVGRTDYACAFAVAAGGTANITLSGTNTLTSGSKRAGLEIPETATVTIAGDGSLEANGGNSSAGIGGGNNNNNGGSIKISGGTVTANGGIGGAGIGGGHRGIGGTIEISGGEVTANGGRDGAGIGGGSSNNGGSIKISGGTVTANGGIGGAGIGGGGNPNGDVSFNNSGGIIKISGGTVTANGGRDGAGIGGGISGNGGTITIENGKIEANGSDGGAGIGGGKKGSGGDITIDGNPVVFAKGGNTGVNAIGSGENSSDTTAPTLTQGVVFEGETGTVHGSPKLPGDLTIPAGSTLTVPDGSTLTIPDGTTLTNNGTIENNGTVENNGAVNGSGKIENSGTINDHSDGISVTVNDTGTVNKPSEVEISFWNSQNGQITQATYGDTIKITATAQRKATNTLARGAALNKMDFYIGTIVPEHHIGTADVATSSSTATATLEITLSGEIWNKGFSPGVNTIIADFGGAGALNLLGSIGTANLTVERELSDTAAKITAPAAGVMPEKTATVDGSANYTVQKVTWSGALAADGSFDYDTAYTAEITLNAKQYYRFANPVTGTINGQTANVSRKSGTKVVLSYTFDKTGPQTWAVTVENGTSDKAAAAEGETVSITAGTAPAGQTFDKWTTADGVTFANENAASTTFIMPAKAVTVTATYKALPPNTYAITVKNGTSNKAVAAKGETVTITAGSAPAGQTFDKWTTADGMAFANENAASTTFLMPAKAVTVTATYRSSGGGGSSSGGGGGSYSVPEPQSIYTVTGGNISRSVSRSGLKKLADSGKSLTLSCDKASMTFDPTALKAIVAAVPATAGNITFTAAPADLGAFPDAAAQIGTHPVYDFTISYKDSKGNAVKADVNFPAGSASISLNYAPAAAEVTGSLFMVYVDGKGAVTWLDKSSYDNGKVLAEVPHFSTYGVAYKAPATVFTDIANHWAKADIEFVAARGLLSGTGNNLFSPDGTMTRGMFVTALGRLAGVNPASYQTRSFTDVKADTYYAAYVEWAAQKNIVKGTGEGLFSPDTPVTREQMAVMMTNYAGQMGYSIPTPLAAVTFADSDKISAWAAKEVAAMQRAGIIKGKDGNRFDPQARATRAEVSAVLRRFVEVVIDPATATGWVKNDSGHWLYYKGGTALTGWQTIGKLRYFFNSDGVMHEGWKQDTDTNKWYYWTNAGAVTGWREIDGKWYYFDENGVMAVNTKVDGYEIGPDGARK